MGLKIAVAVDIGRVSEKNDDRALAGEHIYNNEQGMINADIPALVAVCDGVGGYGGGGLAAEIALQELKKYPPEELENAVKLESVLKKIELIIEEKQSENTECANMCTTIAAVIFGKDKMTFFHAGDSRIYHYDGCFLRQLTNDHSKIQEAIDGGIVSIQEANKLINRSVITRCLGRGTKILPEIQVSNITIEEGEFYLLCTDGLWDVIGRKQMKDILDNEQSLLEKARMLVELAKKCGSEDNISVCICGLSDTIQKAEDEIFFF